MAQMRGSTLELLGLGSPLDIFSQARMPAQLEGLIDEVFGPASNRGALVITGGSGIVGSGKAMQLGARLVEFGVPVVALDFPGAPDGLGGQYGGLKRTFGEAQAAAIMADIVEMNYDGKRLPPMLAKFSPRFVLEAIPEILTVKRAHYDLWRADYPKAEIRSVTSGFPSSELGVGILHPSFPHPINKIWEVVEAKPSRITQLLWALGLIPLPVGDHWSFVLDVLFCGVTLAALRYHQATNMPYWKVDKLVRRLLGPNPVRAHDAIGPGASFLTWSCLHHLAGKYGPLFEPVPELIRRKTSGESWYPTNRPLVDWTLDDVETFHRWLLGPIFQMTGLIIHENRATLPIMNAIGELCAQFSVGTPALARRMGKKQVIKLVEGYHTVHHAAAGKSWHPEVLSRMESPEWQQLYVNAEHNGKFGIITISRESINSDLIAELNRAIDWLKQAGIKRVVLSGDFHLNTQLVGADTSEFYPALDDQEAGFRIARDWSLAARRLYREFELSVGFVHGKRCLGGMLELMSHCHYLVAVESSLLGMPEVTLPVVPGMEGCHWSLRRCQMDKRGSIVRMLLDGKAIRAGETVGLLVDFAGSLEEALKTANRLLTSGKGELPLRAVEEGAVTLPEPFADVDNPATADGRKAIAECIRHACRVPLGEALEVQARHSAAFMVSPACHRGEVGKSRRRVWEV